MELTMQTPLMRRYKAIFESGYFSDVSFLVGADKNEGVETISAHRCILVSKSSVFKTMFCREVEDTRTHDEEIKVPDASPIAFKCMLEWIYTDDIDLSLINVLPIVYCAKKYNLPELNEKCFQFLRNNVKSKNLCELLAQAKENYLSELIQWILNCIGINASESLTSDSFLAIKDNGLVKDILSNDILHLEEVHVLNAALSWASARKESEDKKFKSLREILGPAFNSIRFPLLSSSQLTDILPLQLLSPEEVSETCNYIHKKKAGPSPTFPYKPRLRFMNRFETVAVGSYCHSTHFIEFTVSQHIRIHGYGILRPTQRGNGYTGTIGLESMDASKKKRLGVKSFDLAHGNDPNSIECIIFDEPINIRPKMRYRASLLLSQEEYSLQEVCFYVGRGGKVKMTLDGVEFIFIKNNHGNMDTNVTSGQIPGIFLVPSPNERSIYVNI